MKRLLNQTGQKIRAGLKRLSFRTGLIVLLMCIPFYVLSFAQMGLDISYTMKGVLWAVFFGLAKTTQYLGLAIIGAEGMKKLKGWLSSLRKNRVS